MIGENAPRLERYSRVFPESEQMQNVIAQVYGDILNFYCYTIKFFRRRAALMILKLSYNDIDRRIGDIVEDMKRHQKLVDLEAQAEDIERSQRERDAYKTAELEKAKAKVAKDRKACLTWLGADEIHPRQMKEDALHRRAPSTGSWLLKSEELRGWLTEKNHVWLHGKPGAGTYLLDIPFSSKEHTIWTRPSSRGMGYRRVQNWLKTNE